MNKQNETISYPSILSQISSYTNNKTKSEEPLYVLTIAIETISINKRIYFPSPPSFILGAKFLSFPSFQFTTKYYPLQNRIEIKDTKSLYFSYNDLPTLKHFLQITPLYIALIIKQTGKVFCSSHINLSLFSSDAFLNYNNERKPLPRRKILQIFNEVNDCVGEIDISLIIRREYIKSSQANVSKEYTKRFVYGTPEQCANDPRVMYTDILLNNLYTKSYEEEKEESDKKLIVKEKGKNRDRGVYKEIFIGEHQKNPDMISLTHNIINTNEEMCKDIEESTVKEREKKTEGQKKHIKIPSQYPMSNFEIKEDKEYRNEFMNYDKLMKQVYKVNK